MRTKMLSLFIFSFPYKLAEFQADEELVFGPRVKAAKAAASPPKPKPAKTLRVAASAPPPLPPSAHPMMWPEQPLPRLQPGLTADECQVISTIIRFQYPSMLKSTRLKDYPPITAVKVYILVVVHACTYGLNGLGLL